MHDLLYVIYYALCTMYYAFIRIHYALCIIHYAPWTKISVFSADISSKYQFSVSLEKKNAQKFRLSDFSLKFPTFPIFSQFFAFVILLQKSQKIVSSGIRTTQNAWKWHTPTTKPLIALNIYSANFFYIILLFIFS